MDMSLLLPGHGPMARALHCALAGGGLTPGGETCPGLAAVPRCRVGGGCCGYASYFGHANLFHVNIARTELHHSVDPIDSVCQEIFIRVVSLVKILRFLDNLSEIHV